MTNKTQRHILLALGLILAAIFTYHFALNHCLRRLYFPNAESFTLDAACSGTAAVPFQYRVLVPWTINFLRSTLPLRLGIASPWGVMLPIDFAATFALLVSLWIWLGQWTKNPLYKALGMLLSCNALMATYLVPTKLCCFYWYDIPAVFFFTTGLILIRGNRIGWFYLLFLVATINKETSCFLSVAFLVMRWKRAPHTTALHVAAQAGLWIMLKLMLHHAIETGPSQPFWWTLSRNLPALLSLRSLGLLVSALGFIPLLTMACWTFVNDSEAKQLVAVSGLFLCGMLLVGYVEEIRIYGEMLPILLPACVLGMVNALRSSIGRTSEVNVPRHEP